jgi:hypothetical protein
MHQHLRPRLQIAHDRMGIQIPEQQHHLEKQQAGGPDRGRSAEPGQNNLRDHRLHLEQQERGNENREGVEKHELTF